MASGMESTQATRPLQDASGSSAKQTSDNHESKPREQKKSVDRKISFNPATADPDPALGGATEAGGSYINNLFRILYLFIWFTIVI